MASRITVDQDKCDGFGNGVMGAPDFFGLDKGGRVRLKQHIVGADRLQTVRRAVYDSPVSATRCVDDPET